MYRDMYRNQYKNKYKSTYENKCENKYENRIIIDCDRALKFVIERSKRFSQRENIEIDGNCYYLDPQGQNEGALYRNTTTPDGFTVDSEGRWVVNGAVQKQ